MLTTKIESSCARLHVVFKNKDSGEKLKVWLTYAYMTQAQEN